MNRAREVQGKMMDETQRPKAPMLMDGEIWLSVGGVVVWDGEIHGNNNFHK